MAELRPKSSTRRRGSTKGGNGPSCYNVKCVVLGDGDVGKTSFLLTYLCGRCPDDIAPGPMDSLSEYDHLTKHPVTLTQENTQIQMSLVDTYGQDEYERLRDKIGGYADVYLLCFDVNRPLTFERIKHHWLPEFRRYSAPDTPFVVVGLKTDLRSKALASEDYDPSTVVTFGEGQKGSQALGAAHYVECCAKTNTSGVRRVLEKTSQAAVMSMLLADVKRNSNCVLS